MSDRGANEPNHSEAACNMTKWACMEREIGVPPRGKGTQELGQVVLVNRKILKEHPELLAQIQMLPGGREEAQR